MRTGLDDNQAAVASVPPSGFTVIGFVQHMAEIVAVLVGVAVELRVLSPLVHRATPGDQVDQYADDRDE